MKPEDQEKNNTVPQPSSGNPGEDAPPPRRLSFRATPIRFFFMPPNVFTFLRILIVPLLIIFMYQDTRTFGLIAALLFIIAATSDILDGYWARKMKVESKVGQLLDPLADKLVIMTALIMMIPTDRVPAWLVVIFLAREFMITGIRGIAAEEGIIIAAGRLGKAKTFLQFLAIVLLILKYEYYGVNTYIAGFITLLIALIFSLWSAYDYTKGLLRETFSNNS